MLTKRSKFLGLIILIIILTITMTACDTGNGVGDLVDETLEVTGTEKIPDINVGHGTDFENINLPEEIKITLSDNSTKILDVNWLEGDYDGEIAGTYTVMGELDLKDGIINPDDIYPTVQVTVHEEGITLYTITVNYDHDKGTVTGYGDYEEGKEVELTATAKEDYELLKWTGYKESTEATITFNMPAENVELTAVFEEEGITKKLDPNGDVVSGEGETEGVKVGVTENALNDEVEVKIRRADDPRNEVPFPSYLEEENEVVGDFYELNVSEDILINKDDEGLIIGLPVPENVNYDEIEGMAILSPEGYIEVRGGEAESSDRWNRFSVNYWEEHNSYAAVWPIPSSEPTFAVLLKNDSLIRESSDIFSPKKGIASTVAPGFTIVTKGFLFAPVDFEDEHVEKAIDILDNAYDFFVNELGYKPPRLNRKKEIQGEIPPKIVPGKYKYVVRYDADPPSRGQYIYRSIRDLGGGRAITYITDKDDLPGESDYFSTITAHEFFHSLQYAYSSFFNAYSFPYSDEAKYGVVEGTAYAAQNTLCTTEITRSEGGRFEVGDILLNEYIANPSVSAENIHQDFWIYIGKNIIEEVDSYDHFDFLIPLFEKGGEVSDINDLLKSKWQSNEGEPFNDLGDAYWQFIKNQSFEMEEYLGHNVPFYQDLQDDFDDICYYDMLNHSELYELDWVPSKDMATVHLEPLQSKFYEITLKEGDITASQVNVNIESDNPDVNYKIYPAFYIDDYKLAGKGGPHDPSGYWVGWEDGYCSDPKNDNQPQTFDIDDEDISFFVLVSNTSSFQSAENIEFNIEEEVIDSYILDIEIQGQGSTDPTEGYHTYNEGDAVKISAYPDEGWEFSHWEGQVSDSYSADTMVTMDQDKTVIAHFVEEDDGGKIVEFEDPVLEEDIRNIINKPEGDIYLSDVIDIKVLGTDRHYISDEKVIESFEGIQYLKNLEELSFYGYGVDDLNPIGELSNLKTLSFGGWEPTFIEDISPIGNLKNLETLNIAANRASDISAIGELENLKKLHLWRSVVDGNISFLSNLENLKYLYIQNNGINNISAISHLSNLESLYFGFNYIDDISPVKNLTNLKVLKMGGAVEGIPEEANKFNDLSPIEKLKDLEILTFHYSNVSDISVLENLTNLKELNFHNAKVSDILPLVNNKGLGNGDFIDMRWNNLNLDTNSEDKQNINALIERGVDVKYKPTW